MLVFLTFKHPDPPICQATGRDLSRRNGCVWRVVTKRTSAPRPAEGIPARQIGACHNALLSPGPQCVLTEMT
jgi:hypothetical protein